MSLPFSRIPPRAKKVVTPFEVHVPQVRVDEMITLLKLSKLAPETSTGYPLCVTFLGKDRRDTLDFAPRMARYYPMLSLGLEDICLPRLGNFLEFLPILELLRNSYTPETLPYHVIVPSLPGYAFSSPPPLDRDFRIEDVARIFNRLMQDLGFGDGYAVQGGDVGSKVARVMAAEHESCKVNFCIMPEPQGTVDTLSQPEKQGLKRTADFIRLGSSYALEQATKPSTLSFALASNPLSLLAWIGEKFLDWTDEDPPMDTILESAGMSPLEFHPMELNLLQLFTPGNVGAHEDPKWHINKPFGFSWFPKELAPIPQSWAATTGNLVFYRQHDAGGHFAAMEQPKVLLQDIQEFISQNAASKYLVSPREEATHNDMELSQAISVPTREVHEDMGRSNSPPQGVFVYINNQPGQSHTTHNMRLVRSQAMHHYRQQQRMRIHVDDAVNTNDSTYITNRSLSHEVIHDSASYEQPRDQDIPPVLPYSILGAGRVDPFGALALSSSRALLKYLDHWITILATSLCGLPTRQAGGASLKSVWMPRASGDPTLLSATVFSSVAHLRLRGTEPGPDYFLLKGEVMRRINLNLNDPVKAVSDTNIAAVLCLVTFENDENSALQRKAHMDGLGQMVVLRGGLHRLGFDGMLAKMLVLCDILNAALDNTKSQFFPHELPCLNYSSLSTNTGSISASSPLINCNDFEKIHALQPRGGDISSVVQNMQLLTTMFRCGHHKVSAAEDIKSSDRAINLDQYLELRSCELRSKSTQNAVDYILEACLLAAGVYRNAVLYCIPFTDPINQAPVKALRLVLERIGIEGSWSLIPGVLLWVLVTGGAAARGSPESDYFLGQLIRVGMGVGLQHWDEIRIAILNFVWVQEEVQMYSETL
ncbi:hypothetical protein V501_01891 [Pseudogymnoascus sp. VKM F-4519 (FW-2642)]|nr:hypothetical protein V501_01891 [Pseudogymnoascus sp. VKM F-4519 (FW-2642)]